VGEKNCMWDQIKLVMRHMKIHFNVLQETNNLERHMSIKVKRSLEQLEDKVQISNEVIKFLNNRR
jgi:hypothetical protein